jgi:hypothetical protein
VLSAFLERLPRSTRDAAALARGHDDRLQSDRVLVEAPVDRPVRHVVEGRHPSLGAPECLQVLAGHDVALAVSDTPGAWPCFEERTTDLM